MEEEQEEMVVVEGSGEGEGAGAGCILLLMTPCLGGRAEGKGKGMMARLAGRCRLGRGGIRLGLGGSRGLGVGGEGVVGLVGLGGLVGILSRWLKKERKRRGCGKLREIGEGVGARLGVMVG